MSRKQTCLKPIYAKTENGDRGRIERYEFDFPEVITEDLGFEMQFGFPAPKDLPSRYIGDEYPRPQGLRTFYINSWTY